MVKVYYCLTLNENAIINKLILFCFLLPFTQYESKVTFFLNVCMPFNCLALRYRSYAEIERCLCSFIQNVFQEQVMHSKNILMLLFIEKILLLICQKLGCSLSYFTSNNGRLALLTRSATYAQCPLMFSSTCLTANWSSS